MEVVGAFLCTARVHTTLVFLLASLLQVSHYALLRLILNDIPAQSAAVTALVENCQSGFIVTDLAIVEVEYAL